MFIYYIPVCYTSIESCTRILNWNLYYSISYIYKQSHKYTYTNYYTIIFYCDISYYHLRYYITQFSGKNTADIILILTLYYIPVLTPIVPILNQDKHSLLNCSMFPFLYLLYQLTHLIISSHYFITLNYLYAIHSISVPVY